MDDTFENTVQCIKTFQTWHIYVKVIELNWWLKPTYAITCVIDRSYYENLSKKNRFYFATLFDWTQIFMNLIKTWRKYRKSNFNHNNFAIIKMNNTVGQCCMLYNQIVSWCNIYHSCLEKGTEERTEKKKIRNEDVLLFLFFIQSMTNKIIKILISLFYCLQLFKWERTLIEIEMD